MTSTVSTPGSIQDTTALLEEELPRLEAQQQTLEHELAAVTARLDSVRTALQALQALSSNGVAPKPAADAAAAPAASVPVPAQAPAPTAETTAPTAPAKEAAPTAETPAQATEEKAAPATATVPKARKAPGSTSRKKTTTKAAASTPQRKRRAAGKATGTQSVKDTDGAKSTEPAKAAKTAKTAKTAAAKDSKTVKTATRTAKAKADGAKPDAKAAKKTASASAAAKDNGGLTEQVVSALAVSGSKPVRARDVAQAVGRADSPAAVNAVRSTLDRLVATSRAQRAGRGLYQASAG